MVTANGCIFTPCRLWFMLCQFSCVKKVLKWQTELLLDCLLSPFRHRYWYYWVTAALIIFRMKKAKGRDGLCSPRTSIASVWNQLKPYSYSQMTLKKDILDLEAKLIYILKVFFFVLFKKNLTTYYTCILCTLIMGIINKWQFMKLRKVLFLSMCSLMKE